MNGQLFQEYWSTSTVEPPPGRSVARVKPVKLWTDGKSGSKTSRAEVQKIITWPRKGIDHLSDDDNISNLLSVTGSSLRLDHNP